MSCFTEFIGLSFIYVIVMMISVLKYFPNFSLSLTCISFWKRTSYLIYTNADEQISHLDVSVKLQVYQMRCLLLYCGDALGGLTFGRDCSTDAMKKPYYVTLNCIVVSVPQYSILFSIKINIIILKDLTRHSHQCICIKIKHQYSLFEAHRHS